MPSLSGNVCSTNAFGHRPRGVFLSAIKTKSPSWKLGCWRNHFYCSWSVGKYSFVHLCQNSFARRWTSFHLALNISDSSNTSWGEHGFLLSRRIWLGVSASKSCGLLDTGVMGLSFRIFSTSTRNVLKVSSLSRHSPTSEYKILLTERMSLSQTPPWWLAAGELNFHSMPLWVSVAWIFSWSHAWIARPW